MSSWICFFLSPGELSRSVSFGDVASSSWVNMFLCGTWVSGCTLWEPLMLYGVYPGIIDDVFFNSICLA